MDRNEVCGLEGGVVTSTDPARSAVARPAPRGWFDERTAKPLLGAVGVLILLLAWQYAAARGALNPAVVSSPTEIAKAFVGQWKSGEIVSNAGVSLLEFVVGFALSVTIGTAVGVGMGLSRTFEYVVDPYVWFLASSPLIAFYPIIVVWLGFGFATVVAITFLLCFTSIAINTFAGVQAADKQLIRAVRAFGGTRRDVIVKVLAPSAAPHILAGVRLGLGRALLGIVLGEMFGSDSGLGASITYHAAQLQTADVFVPLLVLVAIGVGLDRGGAWLERRMLSWRER
jgi:ABC-type nitrate/sulfonate/bicarbonate transport system permease component